MAEAKFFSQPGRLADGIAQFHPPGHTSAEARRISGLDGRADWLAEAKFFSKPGRPADGIAQFHPPGHTSAEARGRMGLKGGLAKAKVSISQSGRPADLRLSRPPAV